MKVSTKGRYGLTIMMELARDYGEGPVSLKIIAERNNLSDHYLEQLAAPLRNSGLVISVRGAYGGYRLAREPEQITVGEVLNVLEGPMSPVEVIDEDDPAKRYLWRLIGERISEVLESVTLKDLIEYQDPEDQDNYMYYI